MIRSVAVVGVGSMGEAVARRIQAAGFGLCVCDVNEAVLARFERSGASVARRAADCAAADLVIVLVATPEQVRSVLVGEHGLRAGLVAGARAPIVVVMSTVPREVVLELHAVLAGAVAGFIDAPISGGLIKAESGTLSVLAGGSAADLSVEQSAAGMRATLAALPATTSALYLNYDGKTIGW